MNAGIMYWDDFGRLYLHKDGTPSVFWLQPRSWHSAGSQIIWIGSFTGRFAIKCGYRSFKSIWSTKIHDMLKPTANAASNGAKFKPIGSPITGFRSARCAGRDLRHTYELGRECVIERRFARSVSACSIMGPPLCNCCQLLAVGLRAVIASAFRVLLPCRPQRSTHEY
jgi:hypothetical protein